MNRPFRRRVKKIIQRRLPSRLQPILVASMGRSGSTLVSEALKKSYAKHRFPWLGQLGHDLTYDEAWNLDDHYLAQGVIYKTHAQACELKYNTRAKVIFLFGLASDAAISVYACRDTKGPDWVEEHFRHLRANGSFNDLSERDVLRFSEQIDGWLGREGVPRLILHYDAIWENQDVISEFVGVPVHLPPRRDRTGPSLVDQATIKRFKKTYAELDSRIAALPRCQILN